MAEFNKDQNPLFPDNTSDSKGMRADTSLAGLFANAGDIAMAGVAVKDQSNLLQAQKAVNIGIDQINQDFSPPTSNLPKDIESYGKKLDVTRKAFLNGNLRESDYQSKIDSLSKQVRARFPGYRNEIDQMISSTLGQSTANDLRRTLMREWSSEVEAMDDDDKRFAIEVTAARQDGALPDGYDLRIAQGKPFTKEYTRSHMASFYSNKARVSSRSAWLDLKVKEGTATKDDLKKGASEELNFSTQRVYEGSLSVLGEKFPALREKLQKGLVKPLSPEEVAQVATSFSNMDNEIKSQLWTAMNHPRYAGLDFKEKQDLINSATAPLELMKEQIENGNYGLLKGSETINKTILQNDLRGWMEGPSGPSVRMINMAKTFADGNAMLDMALLQNPEMQDALRNATLSLTTGELFNPEHKSMQALTEDAKRKSGVIAPEVLKQTYQNSLKILSNKDVSLELAKQQVNLLFSEENQAFLEGFTQKSGWKLFDLMISPRMTERITELSKSDPSIGENYRNWVLNSGMALFNQDIANIRDNNQFGDTIMVKWDAKTGQFKEEINPESANRSAVRPTVGTVYEEWSTSAARDSMLKMNRYIRQLKPILDNEGASVEEAMTKMMERMGVTDVENQGSFFIRLYDAISKGAPQSAIGRALNYDEVYEDSLSKDPDLEGIDLDATGSGKLGSNTKLKQTIRKAEGTTQSYNTRYGGATDIELSLYDVGDVRDMAKIFGKKSGSSAIGAYQFMPDTIDRLVKLGVINEDDRFTPELQEKMADYLIAEATQGAKGREDAGKRLAKVWAGLPQGADNTSPYTGVGQNKGPTITWDELMASF